MTTPPDNNAAILQPHFVAIGQVATAWASFEFSINLAIWSLLGTSQAQGQCVTSQLTSIQTRSRALLALYRLLGGNEKIAAEVNKFFSKEVSQVSLERNRIVHDPIAVEQGGRVVRVQIVADKRLKATIEGDALEDAQRTWDNIKQLSAKFSEYRHKMFEALPASSKRQSEPPDPTRPEKPPLQ